MVEESRMLRVSIFETLQLHLPTVDSAEVLERVMAIADEVDSQLILANALCRGPQHSHQPHVTPEWRVALSC
jgi:hypothetical protein